MKILALDPFHSGSHHQFLHGWQTHSRHEFVCLTLPGRHFKWRMRHAAITFAEQVRAQLSEGARFDVLWGSDMLNLAEFRGLCPELRELPSVVYFHENQLTYPLSPGQSRDYQLVFTNFSTCLAADEVWFNSRYHRDDFLQALVAYLRRMPKPSLCGRVPEIVERSGVYPPGIATSELQTQTRTGPLHIVWPHRWEHDKGPDVFFDALKKLLVQGVPFVVSVIGETFRHTPPVFADARAWLGERVHTWGYQASRRDYLDVLASADVVVSTASHEFFGIAVLEAAGSGCVPVVPKRLAYPETLGDAGVFYDGTAERLADQLIVLATKKQDGGALWDHTRRSPQDVVAPYAWSVAARRMDDAVAQLRQSQ